MTVPTLDPYATLGVPRGASDRQVRLAYRRLARRYHPDLHPGAAATARMQRLNQAWEILSSPARRASYDAGSTTRPQPSQGHWSAPLRTRPAPTYASAGSGRYAEADGPGWAGAVLAAALGLVVLVALLTGVLPFPLAGIAVLVLARGLFARFDEDVR